MKTPTHSPTHTDKHKLSHTLSHTHMRVYITYRKGHTYSWAQFPGDRGGGGPLPNLEGWDTVACIPPKLLAPRRNVVPPPPPLIINAKLRHCTHLNIRSHNHINGTNSHTRITNETNRKTHAQTRLLGFHCRPQSHFASFCFKS